MKKLLAIALSLVLVFGLSFSAFADGTQLGSTDFRQILTSEGKPVTRIVKTKTQEYKVTGIYHATESKEELTYVNQARKAEGLSELKWNAGMEEAAIQRALEQYVSFSHTRPDGSQWHTVVENANGENLAWGMNINLDAKMVTEGWLDSPGHRANILNDAFVSLAVACVETDKGIYWVQLFSVKESPPVKKEIETYQNDADRIQAQFDKCFTNDLVVIEAKKGENTVKTAIKNDLVFYRYNIETNQYRKLKDIKYTVDSGKIKFISPIKGIVIISEGVLQKK